ncbi:MAG: hypothetical protein IJG38_02465 [Thermoguttaceae bacterium]|nr:hypothetical protein [Thermoguttaceae bacterium]
MGIENIRHLKKGDRLKAADINAIVDYLKQHPVNVTPGGLPNIRPQTLFYTASYIPEFSIFPLIPSADETDNTYYAQYCVERYNSEHECRYIRGYFGTNGRYPIPAHSTFYGQIITRDFDTPIRVADYDYENNKTQCGFKNGSWEASVKSTGLVLNGKAPHEDGTCYARLLDTGDIYLLELKHDIPPGIDRCGKICVTSGEAWVMDREHDNDGCSPLCPDGSSGSASDFFSASDECQKVVRKYELAERVYNNSPQWYRAKDRCGNKILYFGFRDIYGTIWLNRTYGVIPDPECCSSSSSSGSSESSEGSSEYSSSEGSTEGSESEDSRGSYCDYTGVVHTIKDIIVNGGRVTFTLQRMTFRDGLLCDVEDGGSESINLCNPDCSSGGSEGV